MWVTLAYETCEAFDDGWLDGWIIGQEVTEELAR